MLDVMLRHRHYGLAIVDIGVFHVDIVRQFDALRLEHILFHGPGRHAGSRALHNDWETLRDTSIQLIRAITQYRVSIFTYDPLISLCIICVQ